MKTKINTLYWGITPLVLFSFALFLTSCQQQEIYVQSDDMLKTAILEKLILDYPDEAYAGEEFAITFSSTCGKVMVERGYLNGEPIMEGDVIVGYEKIYAGLTCDTPGLHWEYLGGGDYSSCSGGTLTETLDEVGTYIYRAKLNQSKIKTSACANCKTIKGNLFECFMVTVTECDSETFTDDRDDHVYKWVKIGDQIWMAENLAFETETGSWAYNDDEANVEVYGRLYDWSTAMAGAAGTYNNPSGIQGICPAGWHLPSYFEWKQLTDNYPWPAFNAGAELKEAGTTHWTVPPPPFGLCPGTNGSGFTALPGGLRNGSGDFLKLGVNGYFWHATGFGGSANGMDLWNESCDFWTRNFPINYGLSVRCVKD